MSLRDRSINKFDVETLFTDVLNFKQIEQIGNLLKLLGRYVFVDRDQLDYFAEQLYGERIGLSYLQKAVKFKLIAEIQDDTNCESVYFQLKAGGFYFLENIGFRYRKLPLDAAKKEREQILAINHYLIEKNYLLSAALVEPFEPLVTTNNVMLVLKLTEDDVADLINKMETKMKILRIEKMHLAEVTLGEKSKGNEESMLLR